MADEHITSAPSHPATTPEGASPGPVDGVAPATAPSATVTAPQPPAAPAPKPPSPSEPKDVYREVAETVVFVVVLVLLLKTFIAEAFVIPTGSMATTLWGYQKYVECPNCGYSFPVNASSEAEATTAESQESNRLRKCECPNCRFDIRVDPKLPYHSGDRVLVFKSLYDTGLRQPQRHDVVVFKFPAEPMDRQTWQQMNYIKRLIGLPEETIAIAQGQLYVWRKRRDIAPPDNRYYGLAKSDTYRWPDKDEEAEIAFQESLKRSRLSLSQRKGQPPDFEIIRKSPEVVLAMRRIVFDNDFQPGREEPSAVRWSADNGWESSASQGRVFQRKQASTSPSWLRYRHLRTPEGKPELITDFMGYNSGSNAIGPNGDHWVGDLILECELKLEKVEPASELRLELVRGVDRFQARFNLQSGECSLVRISRLADRSEIERPLALNWPEDDQAPAKHLTPVKQAGTYRLRFANVDERLTLWVNDELVFGDGVKYPPPDTPGPTAADLAPSSIGLAGAEGSLTHLSLWRDTYYTLGGSHGGGQDPAVLGASATDPESATDLRTLSPRFLYVQPGHYLCLGDNSPQSSDGRNWGMVPERLMLGRALMVYFPFYCPKWPLDAPTNRVGPIR